MYNVNIKPVDIHIMKIALLAIILGCLGSCCAQTHGDVRLADPWYHDTLVTARVEIYWNGRWGTINYDSNGDTSYFGGQAAAGKAACRQLGFAFAVDTGLEIVRTANDSVPILLRDMDCPYSVFSPEATAHILRCSYQQANGSETHYDDMGVTCSNSSQILYNTQVRLVQGGTGYTSSGFVELYTDNDKTWGPVCNLGQYDADTVCRQLGYTNAVGRGSSDSYIGGSAKLDEFTCSTGSSQCLYNCFTYPSTSDDITCSEYSWVNCTFDETIASVNSAGGYDLCNADSPSGSLSKLILVAIIVPVSLIAVFIIVVLSVTIPLICCFCIPGCTGRGRERRYTVVDTHPV